METGRTKYHDPEVAWTDLKKLFAPARAIYRMTPKALHELLLVTPKATWRPLPTSTEPSAERYAITNPAKS